VLVHPLGHTPLIAVLFSGRAWLGSQDKQGNTAVHLAARHRHPQCLALLLEHCDSKVALAKNKVGQLPIHLAALSGCWSSFELLHHAAPASLSVCDRRGITPGGWAEKRGHKVAASPWCSVFARTVRRLCAAVMSAVAIEAGRAAAESNLMCLGLDQAMAAALAREGPFVRDDAEVVAPTKTLLVAPHACFEHHTAPEPVDASLDHPPPENVNRLRVLTEPGCGILRSEEFAALAWHEEPRCAPIGDVLRVHEWVYVRSIKHACEAIPDSPGATANLDGDTAVSHGTFRAALAAVGGVCEAIDRVVKGEVPPPRPCLSLRRPVPRVPGGDSGSQAQLF
jgi:Histone deacetylase domain/Ankyrin repeats (3 copies)